MSDKWTFNGQEFKHEDYPWASGFVYLITNKITGEWYIGKKFLTSVTRKKVKGRANRKVTRKASDWETYFGSSKRFLENVEHYGRENFIREVLSIHEHRNDVNYHEMKQQVDRDVLNDPLSYNDNIMLRFYRREKIPKSAFSVLPKNQDEP